MEKENSSKKSISTANQKSWKEIGKDFKGDWKKTSRPYKIFAGIVIFIAVFLILGAIGSDDTDPNRNSSQKNTPAEPIIEKTAGEKYIEELLVVNDFLKEQMDTISSITSKSYSIWTEEDSLSLVLAMAMVQACYKDIEKLNPPESFRETHNFYKGGAKKYSDAMDYLARGIDTFDTDKLLFASELIEEGTILINRATNSL